MTSVNVKRVGEWLVVSDGTTSRTYPHKTTADDLDAWAAAQDARIAEAIALRDLLRAAAETKRAKES